MDTRLNSTAPQVSLTPAARVDVAQVRGAVRTDMPAPIAVTAQAGSEQTRWRKDPRREPGNTPNRHESSIETDRETGDLVYKTIDPQSRAVLSQYPYESLLKLRAYIKSADEHVNKEA